MRFRNFSIAIILAAVILVVLAAALLANDPFSRKGTADVDLTALYDAIEKRPEAQQKRAEALLHLRDSVNGLPLGIGRFHGLGRLCDEYSTFITDSALSIAHEREMLAARLGNRDLINHARMTTIAVLATTGTLHEAVSQLEEIDYAELPDYLHYYYFHLKRTIYGMMEEYSVREEERTMYAALADQFRDSLLTFCSDDPFHTALITADRLNAHNCPDSALAMLKPFDAVTLPIHQRAILAYTLSESCHLQGDRHGRIRWLAISAESDMRSAVREYISLRELAIELFREGNLEEAHGMLEVCLEDAKLCGVRLRLLELIKIFPEVNSIYLTTVAKQRRDMRTAIIAISLLALLLLATVFLVGRQSRRIAAARRETQLANEQLSRVNGDLNVAIERLHAANAAIAATSRMKEEYIAHYMETCSEYLEKFDNDRKLQLKLLTGGRTEELKKRLKSESFVNSELETFYRGFDTIFRNMYPDFVSQFNACLAEGEQFDVKSGEPLPTELRIFALMRLGVTESSKIARFLRYSPSTIYNYRTRVRNKARGPREDFERLVMTIDP